MKRFFLLAIAMLLTYSCSNEDDCKEKVTGVEIEKIEVIGSYPSGNNNNSYVYKYYISLNYESRMETTKETVEYYKGKGVVCYEGSK